MDTDKTETINRWSHVTGFSIGPGILLDQLVDNFPRNHLLVRLRHHVIEEMYRPGAATTPPVPKDHLGKLNSLPAEDFRVEGETPVRVTGYLESHTATDQPILLDVFGNH